MEHARDEEAEKAAEGSAGESLPVGLEEFFHLALSRLGARPSGEGRDFSLRDPAPKNHAQEKAGSLRSK
jgi:hypothetical protein